MAQLTIYLDDDTRKRIEIAAKNAQTSVSQWVKDQIAQALETNWPANYFDLFGSLADVDLDRPPQTAFEHDAKRKRM